MRRPTRCPRCALGHGVDLWVLSLDGTATVGYRRIHADLAGEDTEWLSVVREFIKNQKRPA